MSLSSAWLKPSISTLYAGRPALPMPKPVLPDDVLDVVGDFAEPLRFRDRVQIGLERGLDLLVLGLVELAHTEAVAEATVRIVDMGDPVQHLVARRQPRVLERGKHRAAGGVEVQRERRVVVGLPEPRHLIEIGRG